jgi:fission process protein 1
MSAQRYVAYTSDVGESFRPVAHPWLIRAAYGISWAYITGDVTHEGYKAYCRQKSLLESSKVQHIPSLEDYRTVMAQRAVFQSIASMGLPAFTIHSVVKYSGKALKNAKNPTIRTWGPIGVRLDLIDG